MRYLKVFRIPIVICLCIITYSCAMRIVEKNNEETLNNSSTVVSREVKREKSTSSEEVITNMNDKVDLVSRGEPRTEEVESTPSPTIEPTATPKPTPVVQEATPEPVVQESVAPVTQEVSTTTTGISKHVPAGTGSKHTFMAWQMVTSPSSKQYKLKVSAGQNFDSDGFGIINGRYVVATKPYYGTIGDYIDVYKDNGEIIQCIIGDQKGSDGGGTQYAHGDGSIIEFVVDRYTWYKGYNGTSSYKSMTSCKPTWTSSNITKIINLGNYWN